MLSKRGRGEVGLELKELKLKSAIFDKSKLEQACSNHLTRVAKKFKERQRRKQIETPKTGRLYPRKKAQGFRRFHKASAVGEYPAPDTMNLVNSLEDQKLSPTKHAVYQDDSQAEYGKWLVNNMERRILPYFDVVEFNNTEGHAERVRLMEEIS